MSRYFDKAKSFFSTQGFRNVLKIFGYLLIGLVVLVVVSAMVLHIYFEKNKSEIVEKINTQLNDNIQGEAKIGDIGYNFLTSFPNFTVVLTDVELSDSLVVIHKRPLLKASEIEMRLNVLNLLKNEVSIDKISINKATINLFKDKNGLSNSNIFKSKKKNSTSENSTTTSIDEVVLKNVKFISENQKGNKLFYFEIKSLESKIKYLSEGWKTDVYLKTVVKSLAFNTHNGSFVKDQEIEGKLAIEFSEEKNKISIVTQKLNIGGDAFNIRANFNLGEVNALFDIAIKTKIKWSNASNLLADNISSRLNRFDLKMPLDASCVIKGDRNADGDPQIVVRALIRKDQLKTSYGTIGNCSFDGEFTNNYKKGFGFNDANSAIIIKDFKGIYKEIPVNIPSGMIKNFDKPVATGKFNSEFNVEKLKTMIKERFIKFSDGKAKVNLDFNVDIVDFKLNKPHFTGDIDVSSASFLYQPKNIYFQKTDIQFHFTEKALLINKIKFQNKANAVFVAGRVDNFLNLYYDAPEKMTINWKIYSPYLDIKQIISVLSYHKSAVPIGVQKEKQSSDLLQTFFTKSKVNLDLLVDKLSYNKMIGNNFKVNVLLTNSSLYVKNGSMRGSGGSAINFDAQLIPKQQLVFFKSNITIKEGEISKFLSSFNNFGVESFSPENIKGKLSLTSSVAGTLNSNNDLIKRSVVGDLKFYIEKGILTDFEPIQKIGKTVFPNRDVNHITFSDLHGIATIKGDRVLVKEFKITSNVLNMDVNGVYSLSKEGTNLGVRIPLRNPENDYKISNLSEREAVRYKGIVVSLLVVDGENGKTKIKLGKLSAETAQEK